MNSRALQGKRLVAAVAFVGALLVLAVQLINPSPVMVSIGEDGAEATQLGQYFTYRDVAVICVSAVLCGSSGTYLILIDHTPTTQSSSEMEARQMPVAEATGGVDASADRSKDDDTWDETPPKALRNNEETIYSVLVEADGELPQRDLVAETDLSKATVSRTLDKLENKELVERKRRGMGNVVRFQ